MLAVDAGVPTACDPILCPNPIAASSGRCGPGSEGTTCVSVKELQVMKDHVKMGCAQADNCFKNATTLGLWCYNDCKGKVYPISRVETGLSDTSQQRARIIPYNDRPSVGGGGASLRFDGVDDMAAATVGNFPRQGFTVMLWVKGTRKSRPDQGLLQFMSAKNGLELQIFNTENLQVYLRGQWSGPTGININSDNMWHHLAVTWTSAARYIGDQSKMAAGELRIFVDCGFTPYTSGVKGSSQSTDVSLDFLPLGVTDPGAKYWCSAGYRPGVTGPQVDKTWAAWKGILAPGSLLSDQGEVSIGQRMACNATTLDTTLTLDRTLAMQKNSTFCRRSARPACNVTFNSTPSIYIPGTYVHQGDCTPTVLGVHLSNGFDNASQCVRNASDPYTTVRYHPGSRQQAVDWMWSLDMDPTAGSQGAPYRHPYMTDTQQQLRMQAMCVGGCFDKANAFLGYLDDMRVYDYPLSYREVGFVSRETVREGINCIDKTIPDASGTLYKGCSHAIDAIYKLGLALYFPFDDPWSLYNADTKSSGIFSGKLDLNSREMAQTTKEAIGNYGTGLGYAMRLGGGAMSTAPAMVPSTAPIFGARYDFVYYPTGTLSLIKIPVRDWDTCANVYDPLQPFSDSFATPLLCNNIACMDSHCVSLTVRLKAASTIGTPASSGTVYRAGVRSECVSDLGAGVCSPFPNCLGELCLQASNIRMSGRGSALNIDKFFLYSGTNLAIDKSAYPGSNSAVICGIMVDLSCPVNAFQLDSGANDYSTPDDRSFTGFSLELVCGDRTEYSNIICHGNMVCDPANGLPSRGRIVTVRPPFTNPPTPRCTYTIFKGNYSVGFYFAYHSTLVGGGGAGADAIKIEVKDVPGEAGTVFSKVFPNPSPQDLLLYSELDSNNLEQIAAWNQPQMESTIIIAAVSTPIPVPAPAIVAEDNVGVIELDFVLDEDQHRRGFNVTVNGPQSAALFDVLAGSAGSVSEAGEMYQALDVHCGVVKPGSTCHLMSPDQVSSGRGGGGDRLTYCDDDTYVRSTSLFEQLRASHPFYQKYGLVSVTCMYNANRTEIWNITGYNYTCLPPCASTQWSYQLEAPGCFNNCSQVFRLGKVAVDRGVVCLNTPGLYPTDTEFACQGGDNNGYICAGNCPSRLTASD